MGFAENFDKEAEQYGISGGISGWYKFSSGDNRVRILTEPKILVSRFGKEFGVCFEGAPYCKEEELKKVKDKDGNPARLNKKWLTWVIDRKEKEIVIVKLPYKVMVALKNLATDSKDGYGFQDFPMPYDINIKVENAGTTAATYSVIPAKNETKITEEEQEAMDKKITPMEQIIEKMKDKAKRKFEGKEVSDKPLEYPEEEINADDINFD